MPVQSRPFCKEMTGGTAVLSEEKIKKMIRLSGYENGLGSVDLRRTRYMKMDYVRLQVIKTVLSVIVAGVFCRFCLLYTMSMKFFTSPRRFRGGPIFCLAA